MLNDDLQDDVPDDLSDDKFSFSEVDEAEYLSIDEGAFDLSEAGILGECEELSAEEDESVNTGEQQQIPVKTVRSCWSESCFYNRKPVLYFPHEWESLEPIPKKYQKSLKWKTSTITPRVVKSLLRRSGFKLIKSGQEWIGTWGNSCTHPCIEKLNQLKN